VKIRTAKLRDMPELLRMAERFIETTEYRGLIAFNPEQVENLMGALIQRPDALLIVADDGGALVGMIGFICYRHMVSAERVASEAFWWSEKPRVGLKLLRAAETWAEEQGAEIIQMIAPNGRVGEVYRRSGYAPIETHWQRRVSR
jgi:hypothetical protein